MASDLTAWTLKISQQQEENDRAEREEGKRLERDIALARKARQARKSGFISPRMNYRATFDQQNPRPPPSTLPSFPSSSAASTVNNALPSSSSSARAPPSTSLASMMGSSQPGPRLTRAPLGGDGRIGPPSSSSASVVMPGMGRGAAATGGGRSAEGGQEQEHNRGGWRREQTASSPSKEHSIRSYTSERADRSPQRPNSSSTFPFERAPPRASASTVPTLPPSASASASAAARPFSFVSQRSSTLPVLTSAPQVPPQLHRSKPSFGTSSYPNPTASASLLLKPIPTPTLAPPVLSGSTAPPSEAFSRPAAAKGPTASLTRLKGRGIVEEQLRKSRLLEGGADAQGLPGISEFGSPSLEEGAGWDGNGSGGRSSRGGSGGFPRSLQRSPSLSSKPSGTTTATTTSTATAQPFLPPASQAKNAFLVLRPTRRHQASSSISQLPSQPPPPLNTTASRHRPTSSVGRLPAISSLASEEPKEQQQPLQIRTADRLFASRQTRESPSSSSLILPQIPGSSRVSVKSLVKSVETSSPVASEPSRRQVGGLPVSTSFVPPFELQRSRANSATRPPISRTPSPTSTITQRVLSPPLSATTTTSTHTSSRTSSSLAPLSPPLSNPYSTFFAPSSASSSATPTMTTLPRSLSPVKPPPADKGIGLPGLALSPELLSSRRYLEHVEAKPVEKRYVRGVGLPGLVAKAVEKEAKLVVQPPPSPTKDARTSMPEERPSSPIKRAFFQPSTTTMIAPARPGSPSKLDLRPSSPIKVAFPSSNAAGPASRPITPVSPSKRSFRPSIAPGSPPKPSAALKSSAMPVRVRKGSRGLSMSEGIEAAAAVVGTVAEEEKLASGGEPSSSAGGLFHPTRDRARKPKTRNRPSLQGPNSATAVAPALIASPVEPTSRAPSQVPVVQQPRPASPVKLDRVSDASPSSPTKLEFQNLAQRKSVWGDQAPIGVRPLSLYSGQETVGATKEETEKDEETGGTRAKVLRFGKALPGMTGVQSEKTLERKEDQMVLPEKKKKQAPIVVETVMRKETRLDPPLPTISIASLLASSSTKTSPSSTALALTLSLEILQISIIGQTAPVSSIPALPWIFYESELLAVVHRSKSKETGLVSSKVWGWKGRRAETEVGGKARKKLEEIGKRLSARVIIVNQGEEDSELMGGLGGKLVTRQGSREHWSSDNTSLYTVQQSHSSLFVDEVELLPTVLTSRHPLILTVLSQVFLYQARGSLGAERIVARQFAASLASGGAEVIEFEEGGEKTEDHELFWMCFGEEAEGGGSRAEHWRWRGGMKGEDEARGWRVKTGAIKGTEITPLSTPLLASHVFAPASGISILLTPFELFVVVSENARSQRQEIRLALKVAEDFSTHQPLLSTRPFTPPVHTLIMPSRVPVDLKTYFRELAFGEEETTPRPYKNVLSFAESHEHLARSQDETWPAWMLKDEEFLPLGVAPTLTPL